MKKTVFSLCVLIMILCSVAVTAAAVPELSFASDPAEINVGRRLDMDELVNVTAEDDIADIIYIVSDESVGQVIDGKFVTKKIGNTVVTAVGLFDVGGETVTDYDAVTVIVNKEGSAVKSYDTNMDGVIDNHDLDAVLAVYGSDNVFCDFNEDGVVNSTDLWLILSMYDESL